MLKTPWWTNAIALGVGALAVFLLIVVPAGPRAAAAESAFNSSIAALAKSNNDLRGKVADLGVQVGSGRQLAEGLEQQNSRLAASLSASEADRSKLEERLGASAGYAGAISGDNSTAQGLVEQVADDIRRALGQGGNPSPAH